MVIRLRALLIGGLLAGVVATAVAAQPDVVAHPVTPGNADAACAHCHDSPHTATEARPDAFDDCASCHGEVHWAPSTFDVARHATLAFGLGGKHATVACTSCHAKGQLLGLPSECAGCHIDRHRGLLGEACETCHTDAAFTPVDGFQHALSGFELEGPHATATCESCHKGSNGQALREGKGAGCATCHAPTHGDIGADCTTCHAVTKGTTFAGARGTYSFDHRKTGFPLERRHRSQACASCHVKGRPKPDARCASCHVTPHKGQLGGQCEDCHSPDRWSLVRFDHDNTLVPMRGSHLMAPCASCHINQTWVGLATTCWDCHAADAASAPPTVPAHRFGRSECQDCHGLWVWAL